MNRIAMVRLNSDALFVRDHVSIDGIYVSSLTLQTDLPQQSGPFSVDATTSVRTAVSGTLIEVRMRHDVRASLAKQKKSKVKSAWHIDVEIAGFYRIENNNSAELTELQAHAFTLAFAVHDLYPYAREAAQSLVSKTGYPPFILPLSFLALPSDENAEIDFPEDGETGKPTHTVR